MNEISKIYKSSTRWCIYSKLQAVLRITSGIGSTSYHKLYAFLKEATNKCYKHTNGLVFTEENLCSKVLKRISATNMANGEMSMVKHQISWRSSKIISGYVHKSVVNITKAAKIFAGVVNRGVTTAASSYSVNGNGPLHLHQRQLIT